MELQNFPLLYAYKCHSLLLLTKFQCHPTTKMIILLIISTLTFIIKATSFSLKLLVLFLSPIGSFYLVMCSPYAKETN